MSLLEARGLTKHYGGVAANDDVDLTVDPGELHAVIGPNGAGKTTLIAQLAGSVKPDRGRVRIDGTDITALPPHRRVARGIARTYQVTNVFERFSTLDNAALALQACDGSSFGFWRPVAAEAGLYERARELLARMGLSERGALPAGALAHGEQRQLEIALALASRPRLLLLDEPMAGLDTGESERMLALIAGLKSSVAIVLVEHDMDAVFRLADRVSVLVYGRRLTTGSPGEIRANEEVRRAYLGAEAAA